MKQKLSVIIPVFNEEKTIKQVISRVKKAWKNLEIIVVDDGSNDGTFKQLKKISKIKLVKHKNNLGKGAAIRSGLKKTSGQIVIIQDADLEYDPNEYKLMLQPIINGQADAVYGSRFVSRQPHRVLLFWHRLGNGMITLTSNVLTNLNLTDVETGYKAFRTEILKKIDLKEDKFGFEVEVTSKLAKIPKIRIYEVGISYFGRTYKEGKKISWKDGLTALWCVFKYKWFD